MTAIHDKIRKLLAEAGKALLTKDCVGTYVGRMAGDHVEINRTVE